MGFFNLFKNKKEELNETGQSSIKNPDTSVAGIHLTALEKNFLRYMDLKDGQRPYIADYWCFEYNLEPEKLIDLFMNRGLLARSDLLYNLNLLSSKDLKCILTRYQLPQTGNKKVLVERICALLTQEQLSCFSSLKPLFYLTEAGHALVDSLPISATKDPDFEDLCIHYILRQDYQSAYHIICEREIHKNMPRIGINWGQELQNGLSEDLVDKIRLFSISPLPKDTNERLIPCVTEIQAGIIFGRLFLLNGTQTAAVIARRTGLNSKTFHLPVLCQKLLTAL